MVERGYDARDNAYAFYKYLKKNHPEQKVYFIINKTSVDYEKVEEDAVLLRFVTFLKTIATCYCNLRTVIGDKGVRLSGGQRQRIVLARVLLGKPKLIILDEATSAPDYESENAVRDTIRTLKDRCTVLIIAHRLATIRGADYAIVLEDGQVAEQGSMQELLHKTDGYLNRMLSVE